MRERSRSLNVLSIETSATPSFRLAGLDRGGLAGHAARAWRDLRKSRKEFSRYAVAHCRPGHVRTLAQRKTILATASCSPTIWIRPSR